MTKPDVICTVETWLDDNINDGEISITDYNICRLDRNRHGGGLAFYVKLCLCYQVLLQHPNDLEFLLFSAFNPQFSYKVHIGLFYCPPSSLSVSMDLLYNTLQDANICCFSNFVLRGDFNINCNNHSHPYFNQLCNLIDSFSLVQVVPEPTHTSPSGSTSLIDLVMISNSSMMSSCSVLPPLGSSDHNGVRVSLKWKLNNTARSNSRRIWRYDLADLVSKHSFLLCYVGRHLHKV